MASSDSTQHSDPIRIEEALDRRTNHSGMVEYLVKLHNIDKMEWVQWNNIYCPQLMDSHAQPGSTDQTATSSSQPNNGIFDV